MAAGIVASALDSVVDVLQGRKGLVRGIIPLPIDRQSGSRHQCPSSQADIREVAEDFREDVDPDRVGHSGRWAQPVVEIVSNLPVDEANKHGETGEVQLAIKDLNVHGSPGAESKSAELCWSCPLHFCQRTKGVG